MSPFLLPKHCRATLKFGGIGLKPEWYEHSYLPNHDAPNLLENGSRECHEPDGSPCVAESVIYLIHARCTLIYVLNQA